MVGYPPSVFRYDYRPGHAGVGEWTQILWDGVSPADTVADESLSDADQRFDRAASGIPPLIGPAQRTDNQSLSSSQIQTGVQLAGLLDLYEMTSPDRTVFVAEFLLPLPAASGHRAHIASGRRMLGEPVVTDGHHFIDEVFA
jgi:hypothetical protein